MRDPAASGGLEMRFHVGSDHAAVALRQQLVRWLTEHDHEVVLDAGPISGDDRVDYPDVAAQVADGVLGDPGSFGLLVCGTGQGVAMAANRHRGIRAAVCCDEYTARMARGHNDANVLCVGARVVGPGKAESILQAFCATSFEGGRHQRRVDKIEAL